MSGGDLQEKISTSPLYLQSLGGVWEAASGRIWQEDRPCRELSALGAWEGTCVSRRSEFSGRALASVVGTCQFTRCCLDDMFIASLELVSQQA